MRSRWSAKALTGLFTALLVCALPFSLSLQLMEYLRVCVLGLALALLYATFARTFQKRYLCLSALAASYAYLLLLLDPATNTSKYVGEPPPVSLFRAMTLAFLLTALLLWMLAAILKGYAQSSWYRQFRRADGYVLAIVGGMALVFTALDVVKATIEHRSVVHAVLGGTKYLDCLVAYFLILRGACVELPGLRIRVRILLFSVLVFCAGVTMVGGFRAVRTYYYVRLPEKDAEARQELSHRERLLRVFFLNSREAGLVYESGYSAGLKQWELAQQALQQVQRFPVLPLVEASVAQNLARGAFRAAAHTLESMPGYYQFSNSQLTQQILLLEEHIRTNSTEHMLFYLAGLLQLHTRATNAAAHCFDEFLADEPQHANAVYFRAALGPAPRASNPLLQMPARGWLQSDSEKKTANEEGDQVVLMNNNRVRGYVWLAPGVYEVSLWARDAGTQPLPGQEGAFDPACKARVWVGGAFQRFRVISADRTFQPYRMTVRVEACPVEVIVEFMNDLCDPKHGWDRNLALQRVEFKRSAQP